MSGLLGLDRKAMEQERLARLGKRKRSASPERPSKMMPRVALSDQTASVPARKDRDYGTKSGVQYPKGAIKRTWAFKHPRTDDIKIEEVLQSSTLNIAVLSAFDWDDKWLFSKIPPEEVKQIWVMNAKGQDLQDKLRLEALDAKIPNHRVHFPPMDGQIMSMHGKMMLLFHDTHLRVVISSANNTKTDWGETNQDPRTGESWQPGVMENSVFLVDLPRHEDKDVGSKGDLTLFGKELLNYLETQGVGKNVCEGLLKFDFSKTDHIAFVHSIPGKHTEQFQSRTGLPGLANAICKLGLDDVESLELDYAASSLGAIKETFLKQLYSAARGQFSPDPVVPTNFLERIRIYYPTRDTVRSSTGGPACGGIISLNRKDYYSPLFPKQCMRDYKSTRPGLLSHNKVLLARGRKKDGTGFAWAYVGSANLSESAWGSQKILKSGKDGKLNIRNWECGVVVPVIEVSKDLKLEAGEGPRMNVFEGTLEVPFQCPGEKYGDKQPWFFREEE